MLFFPEEKTFIDKNLPFESGSISTTDLYVNGIHNRRVQRLPIEMSHQEWKFKKQQYRKEAVKRRLFSTPTTVHSGIDLKGNDYG